MSGAPEPEACSRWRRCRRRAAFSLLLLPLAVAPPSGHTAALSYPETPKTNLIDNDHGVEVADPYRWLEDASSPATRAWVDAHAPAIAPASG